MPTIGRTPDQVRNELNAGQAGQQAVQGAQNTALQLGESRQGAQDRAFQSMDTLREQARQHDTGLEEQTRSHKMREAISQDEQDIQKADKGLQSTGTSRADALRAEMDRGRQQTQMDKPLEIQGGERATIAPTPERVANEKAKTESAELTARARFANAMRLQNTAHIQGDEKVKQEAAKTANSYIESAQGLQTKFKLAASGKTELDDSDWDQVRNLATKLGDTHPNPELMTEIDNKTPGPKVREFLQANKDHWNLQYVAGTGDMPDGRFIDSGSHMMQALTQSSVAVTAWLKIADDMSSGMFSVGMKIKDEADRNRVIRKLAANAILIQEQLQAAAQQKQQNLIPPQGGQDVGPQRPKVGESIFNPDGSRKPAVGIGRSIYDSGDARAETDAIRRRKEAGFGGQR